jgi:CHAD domain-containing protein
VRIRAKKLRYVAEFLDPRGHDRRRQRFLDASEAVQKHFGALQDLATLRTSLGALVAGGTTADDVASEALGFAAGYLAGAKATERDTLIGKAKKAHQAFRSAKPIW